MPYPVCSKCVGWKYLCGQCQKKYESGALTSHDVEASRAFHSLIGDALILKHAVSTKEDVVLVVSREDVGKAIGASGVNLKKLAEAFRKPVKVVGDGDFREVAEAIIAPAQVKSINTVFGKHGEILRVHVDRRDVPRLRHTVDDTQKLLTSLVGASAELVFD